MAWFLRAVQEAPTTWVCRLGLRDLDTHSSLAEALSHLSRVAAASGDDEFHIFVHAEEVDPVEYVPAQSQVQGANGHDRPA